MITNNGNIFLNVEACDEQLCQQSCEHETCSLCHKCLDEDNLFHLHNAYREHQRRGDFKRVFPSENHFGDEFINQLSPNNQISAKWFREKCKKSKDWC